jgi:hydroxymethylbilane synthase
MSCSRCSQSSNETPNSRHHVTSQQDLGHLRQLVVGTRGSALARAQTEEALEPLRVAMPDLDVDVRVIRTAGDRDRRVSLAVIGGSGVFVKEIERALLAGVVSLAVHSLKDLPPRLEPGLALLAVPARADPRDALVSRDRLTLEQMTPGSRVGTGSARRRALLLHLRPDIEVVDVRGNVETRIAQVRDGSLDAVILAAAGLERLGRLDDATEIFPPEVMLPSPGQGALAIEGRAEDPFAREMAMLIDDPASHACALAERAFLDRLGAGCNSPLGAYARMVDGTIELRAMIASVDGDRAQISNFHGPAADATTVGVQLAIELMEAGLG